MFLFSASAEPDQLYGNAKSERPYVYQKQFVIFYFSTWFMCLYYDNSIDFTLSRWYNDPTERMYVNRKDDAIC